MDPSTLGAIIGGGIVNLIIWGAVLIFFLKDRRRRAAAKRQVDKRAWQPMFGTPVSGWTRAWAWKPVHTLDHGYIWLRPYWRRRIHKKQHLPGGADFWWQNIWKLTYVFREQQPAPVKRGLVDPDLWP